MMQAHHPKNMRTTLDIDEDILLAAKELSRRQAIPAGKVLSQLARQALAGETATRGVTEQLLPPHTVAGFRPFESQGGSVVTNELIDALRDAEGL